MSFLPPNRSATLLNGALVLHELNLVLDAEAGARLTGRMEFDIPGGKSVLFE
jgi:hypothetical protein